MATLETALLAALSRHLAGEGELNLKTHTHPDGSYFLTCERTNGFWGVPSDDVNALAEAIISSLFPSPATMGRKGGLKGGQSTSEAKRAASAANGRKGGRRKQAAPLAALEESGAK